MSNFNKTILTEKGKSLLSQSIAEKKIITFTKMKTSSKDYNSVNNLNQLTELEEVKQTVNISNVEKKDNDKIIIQSTIDNSSLTVGYDVKTIGIYAKDYLNNEVLFSIFTTTKADYLPQNNGINLSTIDINITYVLSDNNNVTISVLPNAYATVDSINKINNRIDNIKIDDASETTKGIAKIYTHDEVKATGEQVNNIIYDEQAEEPDGWTTNESGDIPNPSKWEKFIATVDNTKILTLKGITNFLRKVIKPAKADSYGVITENRVKELVPTNHLETKANVKTEVIKNALPVGAIISFANNSKNIPTGFLPCNGSNFNKSTYPDLFNVLGVEKLPDLNKDIGQVVAFSTDNLPDGWIWYDDIESKVNRTDYPDLYNYLVKQYGSIVNVPKISDRFIRGVGEGLTLGELQEDEIKSHNISYWTSHTHNSGLWHTDNNDSIATGHNKSDYYQRRIGAVKYEGGDETRPKTIVLKYGIKAKMNSIYYIKAFANTQNVGDINLATLTQELQKKANNIDLENTKTDIINKIDNFLTVRTVDNWTIYKYANGTMMQTGKVIIKSPRTYFGIHKVSYPESFKDKPFVILQTDVPEGVNDDIDTFSVPLNWDSVNVQYTADHIRSTKSMINILSNDVDKWEIYDGQVSILAIGRWK